MISGEFRDIIKSELGWTHYRFYKELKQVNESLGYGFSNRIIAYIIAYENGIDPSNYIEQNDIADYRQAIQMRRTIGQATISKSSNEESITKSKSKKSNKPIFIKIPDLEQLQITNLTKSDLNEAVEMTKVYPLIYIYENSVRQFIKEVLDKEKPDWWKYVNKSIKRRVDDRRKTEKQNAYHGKSRVHPIQYVDFDDLRNIIQSNAKIFNEYMPDKNIEYLQQKLRELKDSRNILMHCNPLTEDDIRRVRLYLAD